MSGVLRLRGVSKTYLDGADKVHALRDVDLSVDPGRMVAVMGPSGSGKSTLLTIAGALESPTAGEVLVAGHSLSAMSRDDRSRLRRRAIGYVFQDFNLMPGLTAAENVALPLELDGTSAGKARAAGLRALEELGLADRASRFPDQLSGGERQRVAIARALVGRPAVVLAAEPTGNLDSVTGQGVVALLHELNADGVTIVVITHDERIAAAMRRRVEIQDGVIVKDTGSHR
jgi:putative ABC transport system ATP-binding protein